MSKLELVNDVTTITVCADQTLVIAQDAIATDVVSIEENPTTIIVSGGNTDITVVEEVTNIIIDEAGGIPATPVKLTSVGGTITVQPCGYNYFNIEVAGAPPVVVPLAITSFTGGSTHELGSVVSSVNLAWSYNYEPDTSQSLNQGIGSVPLSAHAQTYSTPISSNKTFTLTAVDSVRGTATANTSVSFVNRRYFGVYGADVTLTSSDIVALTSELIDSRTKSFISFGCSGSRFVYAYPSRLGAAIVKDGSGFTMQDWYTGTSPYTVAVTNAYGYTENYTVYQSFNRYFGSPTFLFT